MPYPMWNEPKTGILVDRGNGVLAFVESGPEFDALKGTAADWHQAEPSRPPEPPIEEQRAGWTCTPLQMRRALRMTERKSAVDAYIGTQPEEVQEAWEYAIEINRLDPFMVDAIAHMGTPEEGDDLFRLAMTL